MNRSTQIKERFIQCLEKGEIMMGDELEIIEYMVKRLNHILSLNTQKEKKFQNHQPKND
jgi:hypothetical protein